MDDPPRAWVTDERVEVDGLTWAVRQSGDPLGLPVVYFHGTPSCRLEPAFADATAADLGIRLVAFDRPGYGGSTSTGFTLASVAASTGGLADRPGSRPWASPAAGPSRWPARPSWERG